MEVYELISNHRENNPGSRHFDSDTLRFFGERISEMRVLKGMFKVKDYSGNEHSAYCLSSLQRNNPSGKTRKYTYFDADTFETIIT